MNFTEKDIQKEIKYRKSMKKLQIAVLLYLTGIFVAAFAFPDSYAFIYVLLSPILLMVIGGVIYNTLIFRMNQLMRKHLTVPAYLYYENSMDLYGSICNERIDPELAQVFINDILWTLHPHKHLYKLYLSEIKCDPDTMTARPAP